MPKLSDPGEFDLIRDTYFDGIPTQKTEQEQDEMWDRADKRNRNKNNQAR